MRWPYRRSGAGRTWCCQTTSSAKSMNEWGQRRRSEFIQEAIEEKLNRLQRLEAFERVVGSIGDGDIPEWDTPGSVAQWVQELRYHPAKLAEQFEDRER